MQTTTQYLQSFLDTLKDFSSKVSAEFLTKDSNFFGKELKEAEVKDHCLKVGDKIPFFRLHNHQNQLLFSDELLDKRWLVLVFYRGAWCPFCNLYLNYLQKSLTQIENVPAHLVAISPQTPDNSAKIKKDNNLTFDVLSDLGSEVAKQFRLVFTVPEYLNDVYMRNGVDIQYFNGQGKLELPMPATYIIDKQGIICYAYVEYDYTRRMDPKEIIQFITEYK
ncbi:MAG TPA: alkyl hydroperoxide reductase [Microscillaceae bacterium]|jgi:peroxiredoxin|nr:alkyl hydroperoxide reductase [Microscillaceae bacterium]